MITHGKKVLIYMCPHCNHIVTADVDVFTLSEKELKAVCRCGKTKLGIRRTAERIRISWPCLFCGQTHVKYITAREFLGDEILSGNCAAHGIPSLFLSRDEETEGASDELRAVVDVILDRMDFGDILYDKEVSIETLEILDKYAEEQKICCACGMLSLRTNFNYDHIELRCLTCGAELVLPTTSRGDVKKLRENGGVFLMKKAPGSGTP